MSMPVSPIRGYAAGEVTPGPESVCDCPDREPVHLDDCRYAGHPNGRHDPSEGSYGDRSS